MQQIEAFSATFQERLSLFGLKPGEHYEIHRGISSSFSETAATVAVFFGGANAEFEESDQIRRLGIPVLPIVSAATRVPAELPRSLRSINALIRDPRDSRFQREVTAALQCLGLLPAQRRIFLSYRRDETTAVALQLFETLSARQFDVFLDTHSVSAAADFQATLWHRLCDSDVLVMLDTPDYFSSRWTTAEWGRAIAKDISILQLVWPNHNPSRLSRLATPVLLTTADFADGIRFTQEALDSIAIELERVRGIGIALRHNNLVGTLRSAVEDLGGTLEGVGQRRSVYLNLPSGDSLIVYPVIGVPTSIDVHSCVDLCNGVTSAVVYDHLGISEEWSRHIGWLETQVESVKWLRSREACWHLANIGA